MDELDLKFIDEICNMRVESAYTRHLAIKTHVEAQAEMERDDAIEELYNQVAAKCTKKGKELLFQYANEVAYRECDDVNFYYKTGFTDGIKLAFHLLELAKS